MLDSRMLNGNRADRKPLFLLLVTLAINTTALILSHNYLDGDAHTRTYMALQWLKHPFFIYLPNNVTWVFAPLHCYLNAAALAVWNDPPLVPRLLSLILTSLTILPFYHSVRLAFGEREAFYSALFCCFCTLFIHPAAIGVSEGINLLLVFTAIYFILLYQKSSSWRDLLLAALAGLLATAMRYDSWPLTALMALLLLVYGVKSAAQNTGSSRWRPFVQAIAFAFIAHAFAIMWVLAQWIKLGDPLYMTVNYLDAPEISRHLAASGRLGVTAYHLAFLPAVMFLCAPIGFLAALLGFFRTLKSRQFNIFFWLILVCTVYYLTTFVLTLSRYPLARFVTLPAVIFLCFSGVGLSYLLDRLRYSIKRIVLPVLVVIAVAAPVGLGFFSRPSDNPTAERLRAISPLTNPPAYYYQAVTDCQAILDSGRRLLLDTRNYNHRLLYLDLHQYFDQIEYDWPTDDSLLAFLAAERPPFILRADYPRTDKLIFDLPNGAPTIKAADTPYRLRSRAGIYCIYEIEAIEAAQIDCFLRNSFLYSPVGM